MIDVAFANGKKKEKNIFGRRRWHDTIFGGQARNTFHVHRPFKNFDSHDVLENDNDVGGDLVSISWSAVLFAWAAVAEQSFEPRVGQ